MNSTLLTSLRQAKERLPLPQLMAKLGDGNAAKKSARCPFHEDASASFSVFKGESGAWLWKCHAGCGFGDEIDFLAKRCGLANGDAIREFLALAGVDTGNGSRATQPREAETPSAFDWPKCIAAFTEADARKLSDWRGLSLDFVHWLHSRGAVGTFDGKVAFPNHGDGGKVVSCHVRLENGDWIFKPKGTRTAPLVFGGVAKATVAAKSVGAYG